MMYYTDQEKYTWYALCVCILTDMTPKEAMQYFDLTHDCLKSYKQNFRRIREGKAA